MQAEDKGEMVQEVVKILMQEQGEEGQAPGQEQRAERALIMGKGTLQQLRVATAEEVGRRRFQPHRH